MYMSQVLYRKYRSTSLKEVVGQDHITATLSNALAKGRVAHAYLFSGPRGVGKTSVARILAHRVNDLPYQDSKTHIDIIEIDAASNRRIEEIRNLRDKIHNVPSLTKYKVYIIDEVHMLTKEAFNALLKTLEEPPSHAIFILATTEEHKLPQTIISRTQRYTFKPINVDAVVKHLAQIASSEKIKVSNTALRRIAEFGEGSFRDSISLLDQLRSYSSDITEDDVLTSVGQTNQKVINKLLECITTGNVQEVHQQLAGLESDGAQPAQIAKQLSKILRDKIVSNKFPARTGFSILRGLASVHASYDPQTLLEVTLLEATLENSNSSNKTDPTTPKPKQSSKKLTTTDKKQTEVKTQAPPSKALKFDSKTWSQVLEALKGNYNTLYGLVKAANPEFEPETIILNCGFDFHAKQINQDKNKQLITDAIYKICGQKVNLICKVNKQPRVKTETTKDSAKPTIDTISNIFSGAEVLES